MPYWTRPRPYRAPRRTSTWKRGWLRACLRQRVRGQQEREFLAQTRGRRRFSSFRAHAMYEEVAALAKRLNVYRMFDIVQVDGQTQWLIHNLWRLREDKGAWVMEERDNANPSLWGALKAFPDVALWPIVSHGLPKEVGAVREAVIWKLMRMALPLANRRVMPTQKQLRFNSSGERKTFCSADVLAQKVLARHWQKERGLLNFSRLTGGHVVLRKAVWNHLLTRPLLHHWVAIYGREPSTVLTLERLLKWQGPQRDAVLAAWKTHAPNARPLIQLSSNALCWPEQLYAELQEQIAPAHAWDAPSPPPSEAESNLVLPSLQALDAMWASPSQMLMEVANHASAVGCVDYWHLPAKTQRLLEDLPVPLRAALVAWMATCRREPVEPAVCGRPSRRALQMRAFSSASQLPLNIRQMEGLVLEFRRLEMVNRPPKGQRRSQCVRQYTRRVGRNRLDELRAAHETIVKLPKGKRGTWKTALNRDHPWAVRRAVDALEKQLPTAVAEQKMPARARF